MTYQTANNNQAWTVKQLIILSDSLAIASTNNSVTSAQATQSQDNWTTEQLIKMSHSFAQI